MLPPPTLKLLGGPPLPLFLHPYAWIQRHFGLMPTGMYACHIKFCKGIVGLSRTYFPTQPEQVMGAWMICDFTSFATEFQLFYNDGMIIRKGCVQKNPVHGWKDFRLQQGSNPDPLDQQAGT